MSTFLRGEMNVLNRLKEFRMERVHNSPADRKKHQTSFLSVLGARRISIALPLGSNSGDPFHISRIQSPSEYKRGARGVVPPSLLHKNPWLFSLFTSLHFSYLSCCQSLFHVRMEEWWDTSSTRQKQRWSGGAEADGERGLLPLKGTTGDQVSDEWKKKERKW